MAAKDAPKGTARRDMLIGLQDKAQKKWAEMKAFEEDAPESGKADDGKFMVTFPYPYMNGKLHLGHAFSLSKAEFARGYQRMLGKKALFPFAFHCTGMPIQAAAFKLQKEYKLYGKPLPNFPPSPPELVTQKDLVNPMIVDGVGEYLIGWKAPTSTGGATLTGFSICMRKGADGAYAEVKKVDAAGCAPGAQFSQAIGGLEVGAEYGFKIVSILEGGAKPGVESKPLEKSADGKHALKLMPPKKDDGKEKKGGGGGKEGGGKPPGKPAKVQAKTGGMMTQWDILRSMGISAEDILAFEDPVYWLQYFPPLGQKDLVKFGTGVDWRRTFITTDYNPYYDSFVRWQFHKLRANGDFIAFGKRPSIFSEADDQPCMDHDRDKGEGVGPQEYVALKIKLLEPLPAVLADSPLKGKTIYALAATLRPETMSGQTNVWILPEGEYGCFEAAGDQVYICAHRAARNMSFQGIFPTWGKPKCLMTLKGQSLIGAKCKAPLTPYEAIYMLPLTTISMVKGTAIVTSVPSDSPDDYAAFMDLKNPKKREFYGVDAAWVEPFELIEIIETPDLGKRAAEFMCQKLKIQSQKDVDKLHEAHDIVYNSGFYKGVMLTGPFKGMPVIDAKPKCKEYLCKDGEAFTYLEPEGPVFPRSTPDVECVVALVDQWYLKYGQKEWADAVKKHLETDLECFNPAVHRQFEQALDWLSDWACSRSFGLGTRMPWDEKFLIESLSDSTIYMAYYLVAHHLQGGVLDGRTTGPMGITPGECTEKFWDMVMLGSPNDGTVKVAAEKLKVLRREVEFWYPMDLRVSGYDLIPNHLTMSLYNHAAIWKDEPGMWPRGIFACGHVQVDNEKMSKSKGNFITLEGAMAQWGSDATRFTCADAGDGVLNANYERTISDRAILSLTTELEWLGDILKGSKMKSGIGLRPKGQPGVWLDRWFANEMLKIAKQAADAYGAMKFKEALKVAYYLMQEARDRYRTGTSQVGMDEGLTKQWAEWQALMMAPITPHWSEAMWEMLGLPGCVVKARWPTSETMEDVAITAAGEYLFEVAHSLAAALVNRGKKKPAKGAAPVEAEKPNQVNLYVARSFPRWKEIVMQLVSEKFDSATSVVDKSVMLTIKNHEELNSFNKGKQVAQFAAMVMDEAKTKGTAAFALTMPFDELMVLRENVPYLCSTLNVSAIHLYTESAGEANLPQPEVQATAVPGKPQPHFFFDADVDGHTAKATAAMAGVAAAASSSSAAASTPPAAGAAGGAAKPSVFEFLEQHGVAKVLNDAVNELGTAQPADPYAWLAAHLTKISQQRSKK